VNIELSRNLSILWNELKIKKEDCSDTEKEIKKHLKKLKTFKEVYVERVSDKKLQLIFANDEDLFGTNYKIDLNNNHIIKSRYGFIVMEYDWKGKLPKLIEKIVIMESEE